MFLKGLIVGLCGKELTRSRKMFFVSHEGEEEKAGNRPFLILFFTASA